MTMMIPEARKKVKVTIEGVVYYEVTETTTAAVTIDGPHHTTAQSSSHGAL
jgi:hypothetical protein